MRFLILLVLGLVFLTFTSTVEAVNCGEGTFIGFVGDKCHGSMANCRLENARCYGAKKGYDEETYVIQGFELKVDDIKHLDKEQRVADSLAFEVSEHNAKKLILDSANSGGDLRAIISLIIKEMKTLDKYKEER